MEAVVTVVVVLAYVVGWMTIVVFVSRRLLGRPMGRVRAVIAGVVGIAVFAAFSAVAGTGSDYQWAFFTLQVGLAVLAAMTFLVVAEALVPRGSGLGWMTWRRAMRRRISRSRRYAEIVRLASRHGLVPFTRRRRRAFLDAGEREAFARSLRSALEEGGVTFVKLGQLLSTRRDLVPAEVVDELATLQDRATAETWVAVERVLAEELGASWRDIFDRVDSEPLAAASIAQVHAAVLRSGQRVVVKVQRPDIGDMIERDMDVVARIAHSLEARTRWARRIGAVELARGFATAMRQELDFRIEARNIASIAAAAAERRGHDSGLVRLPRLHEQFCTRRVLVMEQLDGVSLGSADGPTTDRDALARSLLRWLLAGVVLDGVFHADPHPGNVLLLNDGGLGVLDFGSVGRVDPTTQASLQQLLFALDRNDSAAARDALVDVLAAPDDVDERELERSLGKLMVAHLGPAARPDAEMFTSLFRLVSDHGLGVPPEIAAVFRSMATLEGTLARFAPGFAVLDETRTCARTLLGEQLEPAHLREAATNELIALAPVLRPLPRRVARLTAALERGDLSLRMRLFADERDRRFVSSVIQQVLLGFLGATTGLTGALLLGATGGPSVTATVSLLDIFGYNLLLVSVILILRALFTGTHRS